MGYYIKLYQEYEMQKYSSIKNIRDVFMQKHN